MLSIVISVLALSFVESNGTAASTRKKRSCGLSDLFCCHRAQSEPNALQNLMPRPEGGTKRTEIRRSYNLVNHTALIPTEVDIPGNKPVTKCDQSKPCRVGLDLDNEMQIDVITQEDKDVDENDRWNFSPCENQLGYYLPFQENGHTFMSWDWKTANWFFTDDLTGCDVFVAKKSDEENKALIIHSNLNRLKDPNEKEENFRIKGETAERIVNSALFPGFRLVMRLYARPSYPAATNFIEEYKANHSLPGSKIFTYEYDLDNYQDGYIFFGKDGKFYVKAKQGTETVELKATLE